MLFTLVPFITKMSCCTTNLKPHNEVQPKSIDVLSNATCASWCFSNPRGCSGYTFNAKALANNKCMMCTNTIEVSKQCTDATNVATLRPRCFNNVCVAVATESINIVHNTKLYLSQHPYLYIPYPDVNSQPDIGVHVTLNVSYPQNVEIMGPGTLRGDLPFRFGQNISISHDVNFEQCSSYKTAQAAILLNKGGIINVVGQVKPHFAKSFVTVAPVSPIGNTVEVSPNSHVHYTGSADDAERVCAAAFSHVVGTIAVKCVNRCFSVTQDLQGSAKLQLDENNSSLANSAVALNVNLTNLLNDFGSEYLIEYADGPTNNKSTPATLAGIMVTVTFVLFLLTFVFHQRYFKFV